jgi:hypothetical protein
MAERPHLTSSESEEAPAEAPTPKEPELTGPEAAAFEQSGLPASSKAAFLAGYKAGSNPQPDLNR